jgi:hypothetical protein
VEPAEGAATIEVEPSVLTGELRVAPSGTVHRVFVDGHFSGDSSKSIVVTCGDHRVRIGGGGRNQNVAVPCGGSVTVAPR